MAAIKMTDLMVDMILKNGTLDCVQSSYVAPYKGGIVSVDTEGREIKERSQVKKLLLLLEQEVKEIPRVKQGTPAFLSLWAFVLSVAKTFLQLTHKLVLSN